MEVSGRWRLERVLGIGGMAAVYAAVHRNQNRVAIKMLHPEQSLDAIVRTRFLREGYVANSVEHPGAVRVQDDGVTEDGAAFLVMELLEGETLEDRRDRLGGRLPIAEVLALTEQLLSVLEAAHGRGVIHRDLKPDNIFLTTQGKLKVLDFGIAHLRQADHAQGSGTSVGTFMGTPSFMPPEQARARWDQVDARSDLWAAGAVMFTLLSGRLVHEAETISEQLVLAVQAPPPYLRSVAHDVPDYVAAIVDKALSYEKEDRFQSAQEMMLAVRKAMPYAGPPSTTSIAVRADPKLPGAVHEGVDRVGDTMLAPSDSYPGAAKAHGSSLPGLATPPSTLLSSSRSRSRAKTLGMGIAIFCLIVAGLAVSAWRNRAPEAESPAIVEAAPGVEPPTTAVPHPAPISFSAERAFTVPLHLPSASASVPRTKPLPQSAARVVTRSSSSAAPPPAELPKKSDTNLFDKRF
jgi:serine/threonine protein kinase